MVQLKFFFFLIFFIPNLIVNYIIAWMDRVLKFKFSFPRNVDELATKKDWCIAELKKSKALPENAVVNSFRVAEIKQEKIFRSNAGTIEINYSVNGKANTLKCFAKFAPSAGSVFNRTTFNLQLNHVKETNFNTHFVKNDSRIAAPKVYYSNCSAATGNLCLITEWMNEFSEYGENIAWGISDEHLHMVIDGLASLHAAGWKENSERIKYVLPVIDSIVYFFEFTVLQKWSGNARKILRKSWLLMNEPETILHGDARIGNMLFPAENGKGRFVFIDWQAVRKGKAVYDLAYFLILSLNTAHRKKIEMKCLEEYFQLLIAKGVKDYSPQQMQNDYNHACLCVLVLLSLPGLSGEASVEGYGAEVFVYGMNIWRIRLQNKFDSASGGIDFNWIEENYGLNEKEARDAIAEMLNTVEVRLKNTVDAAAFERIQLALPTDI